MIAIYHNSHLLQVYKAIPYECSEKKSSPYDLKIQENKTINKNNQFKVDLIQTYFILLFKY